jgi:hypothetical protein
MEKFYILFDEQKLNEATGKSRMTDIRTDYR